MAGAGAGLGIRVFLEGVEIPAISVQVQAQANSPCTAAIQIPPVAVGMKFLPRTLVHVFFADFHEMSLNVQHRGSPAPVGWGDTNNASADIEGNVDDRSKAYKLMFVGEVVGVQWTKQVLNRSLVLQCVDPSNYWDYAYQWKNTDLFGPGYKAAFSGGGTQLFTNFLFTPAEMLTGVIKQGMRRGSIQYPKTKGLMGGVLRMLEKIGGAYYGRDAKEFKGANPFFAMAELRLHITQMIGAAEGDPTATRLLGGGFFGMFGRTLGNLGDRVSIRKAINALMPVIFHETYPQPCPYYKPGTEGLIAGDIRSDISDMDQYAGVHRAAKHYARELNAYIDEIGTADARFSRDSLLAAAAMCSDIANKLRDRKEATLRAHFVSGANKMRRAAYMLARKPEKAAEALRQATQQFEAAVESQIVITPSKELTPARLYQQIFRPDVWFSAPPMCNVIFPDQYTSINYSRMFLAEPTRLLLKTHNEFFGPNFLTDRLYYAPKADLVKKGDRAKNTWGMMSNDLMEHELYTGILPAFEKMGEWGVFAARAGKVNGPHSKVGMAQRTTNFLFFKSRFQSRQLSVNCYFNPYLAVGFPALIIDKYMDREMVDRHTKMMAALGHVPAEAGKFFGTHFLGNIANINHSLQQGTAGTTQVQLTYAREPDESVEFMGIEKDQTVEKRFGDDAHRTTDVAALTPPRPGNLGPAFGEISSVIDVTNEYVSATNEDAQTLPLYTSRRKGKDALPKVPVGVSRKPRDYGKKVAKMFDGKAPVSFRAFRVAERVPRYRRESVDLPAEEYIRPGWYGDLWHPGNIGKAYREFFGAGAITDPTQISDPAGASTGDPANEAADAFQAASVSNVDTTAGFDDAPAILSIPTKRTTVVGGKEVNYISVMDAVDFLTQVYSYIKQNGHDTQAFIRSYTWRPIATMYDMFGSESLVYDLKTGKPSKTGVEGFHSRAFGDFQNIFTLLPPDVSRAIGASKWGSNSAFAVRADTRKKKRDAVLAYISALRYAQSLLG